VLAAVALLLVIGGVAFAASQRSEPDRSAGPSAGESPATSPSASKSQKQSQSPSPSAQDTPSQEPSTPTPSRSTKPASGAGLAAQKAFLADYFAQAPGGTDEGWALLTPGYQATVGRGSYDGFWRTIESVSVGDVASAGDGAVRATLTYTKTDGGTTTEQHLIQLQDSGDGYLIDGDGPA
jgi:hypothetical protein